jgi:hypothetical protein
MIYCDERMKYCAIERDAARNRQHNETGCEKPAISGGDSLQTGSLALW